MAQLVGHRPAKWKFACSTPSQGTCLGCRFGPWLGRMRGSQSVFLFHTDGLFPSLSPSLPFSQKILKKRKGKKMFKSWGVRGRHWNFPCPGVCNETDATMRSVLGGLGNTSKRRANILAVQEWIMTWRQNSCLRKSLRTYKAPGPDDQNNILPIFLILYSRRHGLPRIPTDNPVFCTQCEGAHNCSAN